MTTSAAAWDRQAYLDHVEQRKLLGPKQRFKPLKKFQLDNKDMRIEEKSHYGWLVAAVICLVVAYALGS